jgi:hypothetical protein
MRCLPLSHKTKEAQRGCGGGLQAGHTELAKYMPKMKEMPALPSLMQLAMQEL